MPHTAPAPHPLVGFASALSRALDKVAHVEPTFMTTPDKAVVLRELHRQEQRLAALRMRVLTVADDVAADAGAPDAAAWSATETRTERRPNTADLRLGEALDRQWHRVGAALGSGRVNVEQARVIVAALDGLPDDLDPALLARAEEHLIDLADDYRPAVLARLGRHLLTVVAPDLAEAEEGRKLEAEERRAREGASLRVERLGDGSTRITMKLPDSTADRLTTYLDAFTSPRHDANDGTPAARPGVAGAPGVHEGDRIPFHRRRAHAFGALLERLDPQTMPEHGGDATTVIVTMSLDQLRAELAGADVIGADVARLSASEVRRLACTASIVPAVLDGAGRVLDLGRSARLFSTAQRRALRLRDRRCRAEGCTVPAAWCDAHHLQAWTRGGRTDLGNGLLLCSWHHHRAHDTAYRHERLSSGDVRFSRRT